MTQQILGQRYSYVSTYLGIDYIASVMDACDRHSYGIVIVKMSQIIL